MHLVQVGCHTGNDPFSDFFKTKQDEVKKAVLIDALPKSVDLCREAYQKTVKPENFGKLNFIKAAIVPDLSNGNTVNFFTPEEGHDGDSNIKYTEFSSTKIDHLEKHQVSNIKTISMPAMTLEQVFKEQNLGTDIDRLFLDAEGLDGELLMSLDFEKFNIPFICFEGTHIGGTHNTKDSEERTAVYQKLKSSGYKIVTIFHHGNPRYGYAHDHCDYNFWAIKNENLAIEIMKYAGHKIKFDNRDSFIVEI